MRIFLRSHISVVVVVDNSCVSFSAVLYLNGDFEGGEFVFAHKNLSTQVGCFCELWTP